MTLRLRWPARHLECTGPSLLNLFSFFLEFLVLRLRLSYPVEVAWGEKIDSLNTTYILTSTRLLVPGPLVIVGDLDGLH